jgi:hypothetical protein
VGSFSALRKRAFVGNGGLRGGEIFVATWQKFFCRGM